MLKKSIFNIVEEKKGEIKIFNTFSKATGVLNESVGKYYLDDKIDLIEKEIQELMKSQGFLVEKSIDELKVLEQKYFQISRNKDALFITLIPTMSCNFKCPYCFEGSECKTNTEIMNFEILKKFSSKNFENLKHVHITLFGGEPLLLKDKIFNYFNYLKKVSQKYNFKYSSNIATNGYLLDEKTIDNLVDVCNCESFQVTLDGNKKTHNLTRKHNNGNNTYNEIISNLKKLINYNKNNCYGKLNILLRINLLNNSLEDINEVLDEFSDNEKNFFKVYFRPIYNTKEFNKINKNKLNLEDFYSIAEQKDFKINFSDDIRFHHCEGDGGKEQIHIMPDFSVWKCINNIENEEAKIGKIDNEGNYTIDENKIKKWQKNNPFNDKKCKNCKMLPICWGGCPLKFIQNGKRICIYEKNFNIFNIISNC